jgi:hypothetical protein
MALIGDTTIGPATAVVAEGALIRIAACERCGAAIMLDPRDCFDAVRLHAEWHRDRDQETRRLGSAARP